MRVNYFLLFFFTLSVSAQIELKIDSISSLDSITSERKFTINYHIENLTDKEVSFILYPKTLTDFNSGSMARTIFYKIYQNKELLDFENIFINKKMKVFRNAQEKAKTQEEKDLILKKFLKDEMKIDMDSIKKKNEKELLIWQKKELLNSNITLKPKERISYSKNLIWDKKRYFKIENNEFYIDEEKPHYIELTINLRKEDLKEELDTKEFQDIMNNPNFIKGWFTSNKVEINFKE